MLYFAILSLILASATSLDFENRPARRRFPPHEDPPPHDVRERPHLTPDQLSPNLSPDDLPDGATIGRVSLPDGRQAMILAYAGILAKDTRLPSYMDITLRQVTDGTRVAQAVVGPFDNIMDCDVSFDQSDISRFSDDFMTSQLKVKTANLTFVARSDFNRSLDQLIDLSDLVRRCHAYQREAYGNLPPSRVHHRQRSKRSLVFPGTKWCGKGDEASEYTTLGNNARTDRCCRQHDHCPYTILGFSNKYGLFNYRFHTVSHCDCDYSFRMCLMMSESGTANMIGSIYFNVIRLPCFQFIKKVVCVRRKWWGHCEEHSPQFVAEIQEALSFRSQI